MIFNREAAWHLLWAGSNFKSQISTHRLGNAGQFAWPKTKCFLWQRERERSGGGVGRMEKIRSSLSLMINRSLFPSLSFCKAFPVLSDVAKGPRAGKPWSSASRPPAAVSTAHRSQYGTSRHRQPGTTCLGCISNEAGGDSIQEWAGIHWAVWQQPFIQPLTNASCAPPFHRTYNIMYELSTYFCWPNRNWIVLTGQCPWARRRHDHDYPRVKSFFIAYAHLGQLILACSVLTASEWGQKS